MKFYLEPARNTPVLTTTEVLVAGSGPSGIVIVMGAAREGAATVLTECSGYFGGMMTTAGVEPIVRQRHESTIESGGLAREIEGTAKSMRASSPEPQSSSQAINAGRFKLVTDAMLEQAGVCRVLHITAVDAIKQGSNSSGIITENKSGRQAILANVIIDCTDDADIAQFTGTSLTKREREELMCMITIFSYANINKNTPVQNIKSTEPKYGDWGADEENKN